ncbi:MAG: sigma-70 family RNA polymerase sigma factor [Gemmatimonadota bacterium]
MTPPHFSDGIADNNGRLTALLDASAKGSPTAFDELIPLVYDDLRGIAHQRLRSERANHTLDTTALVHEAYLRLVEQRDADWRDRAHFFAVASRVIRNVLVDYARRRKTAKRGGSGPLPPLAVGTAPDPLSVVDLLALDQALRRLATHDPRLERIVECRFFGGMTMAETAEALGTSLRTVERDWRRAKAYLYRELHYESDA